MSYQLQRDIAVKIGFNPLSLNDYFTNNWVILINFLTKNHTTIFKLLILYLILLIKKMTKGDHIHDAHDSKDPGKSNYLFVLLFVGGILLIRFLMMR